MAGKYRQQGIIQFKIKAPEAVHLVTEPTVPGVDLPHHSAPKYKGLVLPVVLYVKHVD